MSQARRFEELQVDHEGKDLPVLEPMESAVRPLAKLAVAESVDSVTDGAPALTLAKG